MADKIADMLTQIRNANHKFKETVDLPSSKIKVEIVKVLKDEGFISGYKLTNDQHHHTLRVHMKYSPQKERVIQGIKRISRPSLRVYKNYSDIPPVQNGIGVAIISTSKGVMTGQKAKEKKVGGEVICYIW
jgi:small subunit ribosomal protein S8